MLHSRIITENQLDEWVRGNHQRAQGQIVELVWRLVAASIPNPRYRRFPLGDSIGQHGPDGELDTELGLSPFVPEGRSFWEIGTSLDAGDKATDDYRSLTASTPENIRRASTFVFLTPLSARRTWPHTWKRGAQSAWLRARLKRKQWRDVRVIDGTILIDWLMEFPSVALWLTHAAMGLHTNHILTLEQIWGGLTNVATPPPLGPDLFLANREHACRKLGEVFSGTVRQLRIETRYPNQILDFVAAYVESLASDIKIDALGRSIVVASAEAWTNAMTLKTPHVMVCDFDLDDDPSAPRLLALARNAGHLVVYGGMPSGIPDPSAVTLGDPRGHHVQEALQRAGYKEERARTLAQRSGGNLNSLIRLLQNLSLMPEWSQDSNATEFAIAQLLGTWNENAEADRNIIEQISGKAYGEWIKSIREIAHRPATPLTHREGTWRITARYEAWNVLGPRVFDEDLDRFRQIAIDVLSERDPRLDLEPSKRYSSVLYGITQRYSPQLKNGIATSLALLGSHPEALTSCSINKAENTALLTVRHLLRGADGRSWATLNDLLPLLAEAAPEEFLNAIDNALESDPGPFEYLLSQETTGITGTTYLTGLLWALETLAWSPDYLLRVAMILAELAQKDPGGNWSNRPDKSLTTILLPWFPHTCAPASKRKSVLESLLREFPTVGWALLVSLLPNNMMMTMGTRKPAWREFIPDDWSNQVTLAEHRDQIEDYVDLAIHAAGTDVSRLCALIAQSGNFPPRSRSELLSHLKSVPVLSMTHGDKVLLWKKLIELTSKHRLFSDAHGALNGEAISELASVASILEPSSPLYRHQRIFSEHVLVLFEETDNFEEQQKKLEVRRQNALADIHLFGGVTAVFEFAGSVESPSRVGSVFAAVATDEEERRILPHMLESAHAYLVAFAGGYVWGRLFHKGWEWVDQLNSLDWAPSQIGRFLACLPFRREAWEKSSKLLGEDESHYWSRAGANPYQAEGGLTYAIEKLIKYDRASTAIHCLAALKHKEQELDPGQAVRALQAVHTTPQQIQRLDAFDTIEIIKALQNNPHTNISDLEQIEWLYMPLFSRHQGDFPTTLQRRLSRDPFFFCELIRLVFRSKNAPTTSTEVSEEVALKAEFAYRLLHDWRIPPGGMNGEPFDSDALDQWLDIVKAECAQSGHLEVAKLSVGRVLVYSPGDPNGLWLHGGVAAVLNHREAQDLRDGFCTELFNSRGAFWGSGGREEKELADKFRRKAEEVESQGYHRLSSALKGVAKSYDRFAERQAREGGSDE